MDDDARDYVHELGSSEDQSIFRCQTKKLSPRSRYRTSARRAITREQLLRPSATEIGFLRGDPNSFTGDRSVTQFCSP